VSWVYQRVGRLDEARAAGQKALELAQSIGSDVGVAFSLKCLGRLSRMQAEEMGDGNSQKAETLSESTSLLKKSIERFSRLSEYGPAHPEVGDCYSLLGRTYLEAGELAKADEAIRTAYRLIPDDKSKDYLDLLILSGDLEISRGNREAAEDSYNKALAFRDPGEPSRSEIYARAYLRRGLNRAARGTRELAVTDMTQAAKIWTELGELESAATARWEAIRLTERPSPFVLKLLEYEPPAVRVATIDLHKQRLAARATHWPRRAQPGGAYWGQLIQDGRRRVALEVIDW
jgi:tetratricopeptide (TPR) repeat protein